jgi:DUF1680 family protein
MNRATATASMIMTGLLMMAAGAGVREDEGLQIRPVPFTKVKLEDSFWKPRIETNRTVSIPSAFKKCEETGRIDNFALAGGLIRGEHRGDYPFDDTDVYKVIEGASYSLATHYDSQLDQYLDRIIGLIAAAQEKDGYLYTCRTNRCVRLERWMGKERWEKLNSHELYDCGHLYEAAVAHYQATGKRTLLDVALKNADLIRREFGPGPGQRKCPSGHPIIEMALVKLYLVTGRKDYLDLAGFFIEETGRGRDGHTLSTYSQDHKPIVDQDEMVGHAVRAGYLYSGVADVARLTANQAYRTALDRLWENLVSKKLYLTGGMGSRGAGEGFGENYELPNMTAYCETCASIANVFWNYRMFLLHGDARYIDVLERTLYNGVLSGVSLSGDRFFYDNPLESNGTHERAPWFGCACCPGNITRFIPSVPGYVYATDQSGVYVNLFIAGRAFLSDSEGRIELQQKTEYPWSGDVVLTVGPDRPRKFTLHVRIPGWARNQPVSSDLYRFARTDEQPVGLSINGKAIVPQMDKGYARIERIWKKGDRVVLHLPMPVRSVIAHPDVEDDRGKMALERGPVVYCLEGKDQPGGHAMNAILPCLGEIRLKSEPDFMGGAVVLEGNCAFLERDPQGHLVPVERRFRAIPYALWNNRGRDEMLVWIPTRSEYALPVPEITIASNSKASSSVGYADGLNDRFEPRNSRDTSKPFFTWWLKNGTEEWVQYDFSGEETVSGVQVYWLVADHYDCLARVPASWELLYRSGREWNPVEALDRYGTKADGYNVVRFKPVTTSALRIRARLQSGFSGGIIEWKVDR